MIQNIQTLYPQTLVCGVDEVGRGCLAGPIISVAALFRTWEVGCSGVVDSKSISTKNREVVFKNILKSKELIDFGIGEVEVEEIDFMGIDQANILAFDRAIKSLPERPNFVIIDGIKGAPGFYPHEMLITPKADSFYPIVGAASILAKVIRDGAITELDSQYPHYGWNRNKGYGSQEHITALKSRGPSPYHRKLFIRDIIKSQLAFFPF